MALLAGDLDLFLADFGEEHRIGGQTVVAVVDDLGLNERQGGGELGVAESAMLIYAKVADLPKWRPPGSNLNVDGIEYIVDDWGVDYGMAAIALSVATV